MNTLNTIILRILQDTRNMSMEQQARIIAQKLEHRYKLSPRITDTKSQNNSITALNIVLIKIIRDLFAPKVREKYQEFFKIGTIHTPHGAKELEQQWLKFYRAKGHLVALNAIAQCMVCALNLAKNTKENNELTRLLAHSQNLTDLEFLARLYNAFKDSNQPFFEQVLQDAEKMGQYIYESCVAKLTNTAPNPIPQFSNKELGGMCEKWSMQIQALEVAPRPSESLGDKQESDLRHNIQEFLNTKNTFLCVIRVFNHHEIIKEFGQEGYARQVIVFKRIFLGHFESLCRHHDVFEPKNGVFYLLLEGEKQEIQQCFETFCALLKEQVFNYKEHKQTLKFDGRLFDKHRDFLQTLLDLRAYIGEVQ